MSTNVSSPHLVWVEDRCYRVFETTTRETRQPEALREHDLYENEKIFDDLEFDEEFENFEVLPFGDFQYITSFHVPKHYIGSIIGKKGAVKSRIEHDTRTVIKVPRQGQTGNINITGMNISSVKAARRRINLVVMSSRMKQASTHFISIPMNTPEIMKNFEIFKETVLRECHNNRGVEESLFIKPSKLHLTIGMTCLMDIEERLYASRLFTDAKTKVMMPLLQSNLPFKLRLKGLSYMNDDPREIDVLYGCVKEESAPNGLLQQLADGLVDYFYRAGFMDKEFGRDHVKLHVTLMNSKYRNRSTEKSNHEDTNSQLRKHRNIRETFDGSGILEKFSDYDFGVVQVTEIHLSQRHSMGPDGYYQSTCTVNLS